MIKKKILVTSALPYANGPLHFGHIAGAYLPADCYVRFQRLMHNDILYICGSDEYGIAITLSAELAKRTPKQQVDLFHEINKNFFKQLNISFDHYSRTTWEGHKETTHQFFNDLYANGHIEARITEQLYSEDDGKFLADRYVTGTCPQCGYESARGDECQKCGASYDAVQLKHPRSKLTGKPLTLRPTKHWFLLLDQFKEKLNNWLETKNWKPNVINFIKGYINELHARSITRDLDWGIPVPLPDAIGKVLYVWFDAPIGYISATKEWAQKTGQSDKWKDYWFDPMTILVNFVGKDNIPFHASIFPAMTMGQNQPYKLVDELPANEFYHLEGRQFSKSDGWYIDLEEFFKKYSSDQIRYTIAANAPETADSEFSWKDFQLRCNTDLLGKYGNFANRLLVFIKNNCQSQIPVAKEVEEIDQLFIKKIEDQILQITQSYESFKVRRASQLIMELAQEGNIYFDSKRPWTDIKNPEKRERLNTTLAYSIACLKALALVSYPIIPDSAEKIWNMLNEKQPLHELGWDISKHLLPEKETQINEPVILFRKVEDSEIEQELEKLHEMSRKAHMPKPSQEQTPSPNRISEILPLKSPTSIEQFNALDLRVVSVVEAENVPKSKKLLKLKVNTGMDERIILSGIAEFYKPSDLIGKSLIAVLNLKPVEMMGITSQGMILTIKQGDQLKLLSPGEAISGAIIC